MWNGIFDLFLWILRRLRLFPRLRPQTEGARPGKKSPEKENNTVHEEEWVIWQCPAFRFNLNHLATQLTSIEVMSPTLTIEPVQVALYYTKEADPNIDPNQPPLDPTVVGQEKSGAITITAQHISRQKGVKAFNLCGISLVTQIVPPQHTHIDQAHPSYITLSSNLQHSSALLRHWTLVLEQLSPTLKNLVQVVIIIDHTATHGHQDFSPKRILMKVPKQDMNYQIPSMAILQVLPQQIPDMAQTLHQTTQSQQTCPQPPSPPLSWKRTTCSTPVEDSFSQTLTSSSSSSRTSSPESVILSPCYEKSSTPNQGVLDLVDLEK